MSFSYTQVDNPTGTGPFSFKPSYSSASDIMVMGYNGKHWSPLAVASVSDQTVTLSAATDGLRAIRISNNASKVNAAITNGNDGNLLDENSHLHDNLEIHLEDPTDRTGNSPMSPESITIGGLKKTTQEDVQGYYGYITNYYNFDGSNTTQELDADTWTDLSPTINTTFDGRTTSMIDAAPDIYDPATGFFTLAGLEDGSFGFVRTLVRIDPEVDESTANIRILFETNEATQPSGLTEFTTESQAVVMTQGADKFYSDENIITFFVGNTLSGTTPANAGKFKVQVKSSVEATLEVLGVTFYVNK